MIQLDYYKIVVTTQCSSEVLKAELNNLIEEIEKEYNLSSQLEPPVKPTTCGKCEDCKFWFISPEQEEMLKASNEDIKLHERCNNEDSFVYKPRARRNVKSI